MTPPDLNASARSDIRAAAGSGVRQALSNDSLSADSTAANSVPSVTATPLGNARRFYRPELDVVRFVAFFLVFLTHSLPTAPGPDSGPATLPNVLLQIIYACQRVSVFGLSLFFTLSAFLICELLLREREASGDVHVKQFYVRRILRIWPLYFGGLALGIVIALSLGSRQNTFIWSAWAAVLLGNWYVVFIGFPGNVMFHLWSISVEEQFYLFVPWVVKVLNRRALAAFAFALTVIASFQLFYLGSTHAADRSIWWNSFVQFENFAAGILLCLLLHRRSLNISLGQRLSLLAASALCWFIASYTFQIHIGANSAPGSWSLIAGYGLVAAGCCLLLVAFLGLDKSFLPGWAIYLGSISYGLYVFHMLALHIMDKLLFGTRLAEGWVVALRCAGAMGITILIASASYRYFETPFLKLKRRHEVIASRPV